MYLVPRFSVMGDYLLCLVFNIKMGLHGNLAERHCLPPSGVGREGGEGGEGA